MNIPQSSSSKKGIDYSQKKMLVVDDIKDMRIALQSMLKSTGIAQIDMVASAADAVTKVKARVYDAILCDYDLGHRVRDGQQLLEEMRHCGYISLQTVFLMVTAENRYGKVVSAAELAPDDYLIKPFSADALKGRLDKLFVKKEAFASVYEQISKTNLSGAVLACNDIIWKYWELYLMDAIRLKWNLLMTLERFSEAEELYQKVIQLRAIPWAQLGLAKAFHLQGKDEAAEQLLSKVVIDNPKVVEAYDVLATIQENKWNTHEMQKVLQQWVNVSPKALIRQRRYGDVAVRNGDLATAEKAYQILVEEKFSHHACPSDIAKLSRTYLSRGKVGIAKELISDEKSFLQGTDYGKLVMSSTLSEISSRTGDIGQARRHMQDAMERMSKCDGIDPDILVDMVGTCVNTSMEQEATMLVKRVEEVAWRKHGKRILERIEGIYKEAKKEIPNEKIRQSLLEKADKEQKKKIGEEEKKMKEAEEKIKREIQGIVDHFEAWRRSLAKKIITTLLEESPNNPDLLAKTTYIYLGCINVSNPDVEMFEKAKKHLDTLIRINPDHPDKELLMTQSSVVNGAIELVDMSRLVRESGNNPEILMNTIMSFFRYLNMKQFNKDIFTKAIKLLDILIQQDPTNAKIPTFHQMKERIETKFSVALQDISVVEAEELATSFADAVNSSIDSSMKGQSRSDVWTSPIQEVPPPDDGFDFSTIVLK